MAAKFTISDSESEPSEEVEEGEDNRSSSGQEEQHVLQRHTLTLPELRMGGRTPQRIVGKEGIKEVEGLEVVDLAEHWATGHAYTLLKVCLSILNHNLLQMGLKVYLAFSLYLLFLSVNGSIHVNAQSVSVPFFPKRWAHTEVTVCCVSAPVVSSVCSSTLNNISLLFKSPKDVQCVSAYNQNMLKLTRAVMYS